MNYYSTLYPEIDELVLVVFNKNVDEEGIFKGSLLEYPNYNCIMNYQDATKKKKVKSWNKIIVLNKQMIAKVDNIEKNIIQVSLAYLYEDITIMMESYFQENKLMTQFITTLCVVNNYNYNYIWGTLIYHLDRLRRNDNVSIWNYFNNHINDLHIWISDLSMDKCYIESIMKLYNKKNEIIIQKITTRFGIVNTQSIENIYNIFNTVLSNIKYNYSLKYDTTPYYIFQSETNDSTIDDHNNFIDSLKLSDTFIKIDYIGKS
jgi:ribosomal protein S24E